MKILTFSALALVINTKILAADAPATAPNPETKDKSYLDSAKETMDEALNSETMKKAKEGADKAVDLGKQGWDKGLELKNKIVGARTTRDNRRESDISIFYEPLAYGLWIPTKTGFAATWIINENWSAEVEYLSGSYGLGVVGVDLFDFSERLMLGRLRWTLANSFNMGLGFGERSYRFSLGNDYIAKATDYNAALLPSLKVENQVMTLSIGNRWQFDNGITLGFDWAEIIASVGQGKVDDGVTIHFSDEKSRDNTKDVLRALRYGPTVTAMKFQLGYTF